MTDTHLVTLLLIGGALLLSAADLIVSRGRSLVAWAALLLSAFLVLRFVAA